MNVTSPVPAVPSDRADTQLPLKLGSSLWGGILVIALFFGVLGAWSVMADMESAAIALGSVIVTGERKTIQHLEGGIVRELLVREGSVVDVGSPLVNLETIQAASAKEVLRLRHLGATAMGTRLVAERDGLKNVLFPGWMRSQAKDPKVTAILALQQRTFQSRKSSWTSQSGVLKKRVQQYREEIGGLVFRVEAAKRQLSLLKRELSIISQAVESGLAPITRALNLERNIAEVEGAIGGSQAQIAATQQKVSEAELRLIQLNSSRTEEINESLKEALTEVNDMAERLRAADDVVKRTVIRSPVAGVVMNLQVFTVGGVIHPGRPIMDIIPTGKELLIKVSVEPMDIESVQVGQKARVRITAFNQRSVHTLSGKVVQVSADSLTDERTGATHYEARVVLDTDQEGIKGLTIRPGMSAEVMIITGKRTMFSYLMTPLTKSVHRSFREQ